MLSWFRRQRSPRTRVLQQPTLDVIDGRSYDHTSAYALPKDWNEINRLDYQHFMLRLKMRGNYRAPIAQPSAILDVGCGTGRWAMEMAQAFPHATVMAVDLPTNTLTIPTHPANFRYRQEDLLQGLNCADGHFDFVHMRLLVAAMPANAWQSSINELARVTRPGGWIECVESPLAEGSGSGLLQLNAWIDQVCRARGVDFQLANNVDTFLYHAGLLNITKEDVSIVMGPVGGDIGKRMALNYTTGVEALRPRITSMGFATDQHYERVLETVKQEISAGQVTAPFFVVYGQRGVARTA